MLRSPHSRKVLVKKFGRKRSAIMAYHHVAFVRFVPQPKSLTLDSHFTIRSSRAWLSANAACAIAMFLTTLTVNVS